MDTVVDFAHKILTLEIGYDVNDDFSMDKPTLTVS